MKWWRVESDHLTLTAYLISSLSKSWSIFAAKDVEVVAVVSPSPLPIATRISISLKLIKAPCRKLHTNASEIDSF